MNGRLIGTNNDIGCFVQSTSYHSAIQCKNLFSYRREPITPIDQRFQTSTKSLQNITAI